MSQYRKGACGLTRRVGTDIELKSGVKPIDKKCKYEQLPGKPVGRRSRGSDYSNQLTMKQTMRYYYRMSEKQFRNLYKKSDKMSGSTGDNMIINLESRLDNIVYRLGFASTRAEARQMISHGHIQVNGSRVTIPSYMISVGDTVSVIEKFRGHERVLNAKELYSNKEPIPWLERKENQFEGVVLSHADPAFFSEMFKVNLVIELYSK
tara:strand:- start:13732 stop:14352 length:621 start_codon:yes stop_codon:yes gene_type:complete